MLKAALKAKCEEETELQAQLALARVEAQQLRLRAATSGVRDNASLVPASLSAGAGASSQRGASLAEAEQRSLLEWLASVVDTRRQALFNAPGAVHVGEHEITLGRMVQWHLEAAGDLRVSVPRDLEEDFSALLQRARQGTLGSAEMRKLGQAWELLGADVAVAERTEAVPAIFLIHRESAQAVIVAAWPSIPAAAQAVQAAEAVQDASSPTHAGYDAVAYFGCGVPLPSSTVVSKVVFMSDCGLCTLEGAGQARRAEGHPGIAWEMQGRGVRLVDHLGIGICFDDNDSCTIRGPFGNVAVLDPPPGPEQRELVRHIVMMAGEQDVVIRSLKRAVKRARFQEQVNGPTGGAPSSEVQTANSYLFGVAQGDHVEVEYEGQWFTGVLKRVEGEVAHVHCDVDEPSVITRAHLSSVRPVVRFNRRHTRSRSEPFLFAWRLEKQEAA